ncbi:DUF6794 domain-containing protein [Plebeiibacterium marinum]|uniref:DUF6794 domain-containing protein n=1 Tax=Plebeiibacterium marinum TaxID=2992111 RepID=A0AAE3SIF7_9BACT|nr:DUF6794 domain-containing protein [Plebeiobacterium marinum]MCW3804339.1 hypothetical protein [Plebeiobacterium marinum]
MKTLKILFIFLSLTVTNYCYSQVVIIIWGSDPLGPNSMEEAINDLDSVYFQKQSEELNPVNESEFIEQHEFEVGRYIRRKWGVLGGPSLFKKISQDSIHSPRFLTHLVLSSFYRTFYGDKLETQVSQQVIESAPRRKKYLMRFKIRDGVNVPNAKFRITQIFIKDHLNTSLGTLYPTGKKVGDLVVKKPLKAYLDEWLIQKFSKSTNLDVTITIRDFYSEIAARTWGSEMAVYLSMNISSFEITRSYNLIEFYEPKTVYTGIDVNKAFEDLLEKALIEFNKELR